MVRVNSMTTVSTINAPISYYYSYVSYWRKYVHEVLVNRLGGLSLPRKSVVRLTDRPDMTLDVYRGRKTTIQQQTSPSLRYVYVKRLVCLG